MNILDLLTGTRLASWSDRERHKKIIISLVDKDIVNNIIKVYLLGYISVFGRPLSYLKEEIVNNKISLFDSIGNLPYYHDELGLNISGNTASIYLIITSNKVNKMVIFDSTQNYIIINQTQYLPFIFLKGKKIIYPAPNDTTFL